MVPYADGKSRSTTTEPSREYGKRDGLPEKLHIPLPNQLTATFGWLEKEAWRGSETAVLRRLIWRQEITSQPPGGQPRMVLLLGSNRSGVLMKLDSREFDRKGHIRATRLTWNVNGTLDGIPGTIERITSIRQTASWVLISGGAGCI